MAEKIPKLRLDIFYKQESKQYVFLRRIALTYRLSLSLMSELFQIPEEELKEKLLEYNDDKRKALLYLFYHDISDQDYAKSRLMSFYRKLLIAVMNKDEEAQKSLIDYISDAKMKELIKERNPDLSMSDDNILTMIKYQLKYALTLREVADLVSYPPGSYQYRLENILPQNPNLKERHDRLAEYNLAVREKNRRTMRC